MQQPSPLDAAVPPEYLLPGLDDDDGCAYVGGGAAAPDAEEGERRQRLAGAQLGGGWEERLSMTYQGRAYVFDSVPPQKVETILMLLNGYELAPPQSARPQLTHLVQPIVVPRDFDRTAAVSRCREKRKSTLKFDVKADYSIRREIASRIARRRGKFVSSEKSSGNSSDGGAAARRRQGETTELEHCANCGESSEATPMMRRGPNGYRTFCNACGLMWAKNVEQDQEPGLRWAGRRRMVRLHICCTPADTYNRGSRLTGSSEECHTA
ncbi:GATA transcription factor 28-like [Panicum miliaceum]|uniref:GATA transcription factor 28-like n=1 Tax=Panicum miliaceum TaxID=4540 RepID=A0A3L6Q3U9_PANMI|nr:GATA transcription factor 28-like [Panicum miliaceum]